MLTIILSVIAMLFLFGITIFVHEFGHFIVARKCGLVVETFSIGMGPALWKKEIGGITYKIGILPIGGYVALPQLDPSGMERMQGENENDREELPEISPWKKIAVAFAGPAFNILFAIPLALLVTFSDPVPDHTTIGFVAEESEAYEKGLREGDTILAVNGKSVPGWYEVMVEDVLTQKNGTVKLLVDSGSATNRVELPSESTMEMMMPAMRPLVSDVPSKKPADIAGIKTGDLITAVNGKHIEWWHELSPSLQEYGDQKITITVLRGKKSITMDITPEYTTDKDPKTKEETKRVQIGVAPGDPGMLPWTMEGNVFQQLKNDGTKIFRLLKALTSKSEAKDAAKNVGGPVSIFSMFWFALKLGIFYAIGLTRFININLAILNLLPIPVLDGGHICFSLWEGITRRKVHPKIVTTLVNVFAILLIGTMLLLTWRDADRNWNISRLFKKAPAEQIDKPAAKSKAADEGSEATDDTETTPAAAEPAPAEQTP
ncbi:MAG: RIP metalloprotease RseP [Pontiellaceae bacterium]|nr:RIP metalloprotease RseP [Pontiellaceae bacterium]